MINIEIQSRRIELNRIEQKLANAANSREALFKQFLRQISTKPEYKYKKIISPLNIHEAAWDR